MYEQIPDQNHVGKLRLSLRRSCLCTVAPAHFPRTMRHYYFFPERKNYCEEPMLVLTRCGLALPIIAFQDKILNLCHELQQAGYSGYHYIYWHDYAGECPLNAHYYIAARQWVYIQYCLTTGSLKRLSFFLYGK